jgi:PAS domain S-box-containing protein
MKSALLAKLTPGQAFVPYLVLLAGLIFTAVVCYNLEAFGEAEDQARFKASVQEIGAAIEGRIETYVALLRSGSGLYAASDAVTQTDFQRFVEQLELDKHYSGIQGIGFSAKLSPPDKNALLESMRQQGKSNFKIWPEHDRDEYHAITYLEPLTKINELALGYDMFTEPVRRRAMEQARDSGQAAASRVVTLVQEIDPGKKQAGFLIYVPVYRNGADTSTVEARRKALIGFVYSPFRVDDFLAGILPNRNESLDFRVLDGKLPSAAVLYDSSLFNSPLPEGYKPRFTSAPTLEIPGGQNWTISFASRPGFDQTSSKGFSLYAFASGLVISLLFFAVTYFQIHARSVAEISAAELRDSEATIRKTLADRERAEEALRESEERYKELFENANDIVCTLSLDYRVTSVNKAGEIFTGYSREELQAMDLSQLMTPASAQVSKNMLSKKLAGEVRTNYEVDLVSKSGELVTVEISSRLIQQNGKPVAIQAIARDITVRRRAEEALRQADQRALSEYERLLERIATLSQALGTSHDLVAIFRALRDFSIVSAPCDGIFVSLYDPIRDVRTACYCWGDGQEFDVSDLPPMPITAVGPNSRAVRTGEVIITDSYMQKTRGRPSVTIGPDNGLRPQSSLAAPMAVMGRIIGTIEIQSYQESAYREAHVTAMRMAANLTAVAVENVRLLERESTARATAEESNRLKDEFLATVSHELRTPLTAILGWSRMLESGTLDPESSERAIETIRRNAKSQAQIVDDILDVSRIITGNLYLDLHPIELGPVIENAINVVRPTADAKGIQIELDMEARPVVVSGDSNRLQQVIWNLLSNAVKFTSAGGRVHVAVDHQGSQVEISFTDTGQGISPEFLPFVFDRFRQADSTTTRQHGGLGLGLAIARHLVEIHGGTIRADSQGRGTGSTFTVRLPIIGATVQSSVGEEIGHSLRDRARQELSGLHVLLVDDDEDTLELLRTALTQCQARVTAVTSADEALEVLKQIEPDILISDIAMPGSDGYQLISQVRALDIDSVRSLPAVAITAYAKEEDRLRALACGYQGYVTKPIELAELITAVSQATNGPSNGK